MDLFVIGTPLSLSLSLSLSDCAPHHLTGTQESPLALGASTKWFKTLEETVGDGYVTVATRSMYQNHLWVSTKRAHASKITGVETYQAEQGIGNVWGNKGGTAVALRFNGHRLAFVNTHLAAHAEKVEKRNADIGNIVQEVRFGIYSQVEFHTQYLLRAI